MINGQCYAKRRKTMFISYSKVLFGSCICVPNSYTAENFTPKEAGIILRFRRLSKENQIRIDERINTMLDNQK